MIDLRAPVKTRCVGAKRLVPLIAIASLGGYYVLPGLGLLCVIVILHRLPPQRGAFRILGILNWCRIFLVGAANR